MHQQALDIIAENLAKVLGRSRRAAERAGRDPAGVTLVAVTKEVGPEVAGLLIRAGVADLGESRVQEGERKRAVLGDRCRWHMIGHLQSNKVKKALSVFSTIHSADSTGLMEEISRRSQEQRVRPDVLLEVNVSGEATKSGFSREDLRAAARLAARLPGLNLKGLMTMAPYDPNPEAARPVFRELARLFRDLRETGIAGPGFDVLSMGMSGDFEVAVEEGATHIRVGTALFEGLVLKP